jgi:hypothetical protein
MCDDHLAGEHRLDLVPWADPVQEGKGEVCGRRVEGLLGIRMEDVYDLLKERLGDDPLRRPERADKANAELT